MSESSPALAGSAQRNQRLALVAVVGVAVLGVIAYLLFFSGGSKSSDSGAVPSHPHTAVSSASPTAVQAVPAAYTAAVGRNPVSIIVPCHRVLGSGGSMTGYAGGLERKRKLLALEHSI